MQYIRPYYDSDQKVLVQWYRAAPDAVEVRPFTCFGSASRSDLKDVPVGEVWDLQTYTRNSVGNQDGNLGVRPCATPTGLQRGVSINQAPLDCNCVTLGLKPIDETPLGVIDGTNRIFTLSQLPIGNNWCEVFLNGLKQIEGVDYSLTAQTINFAAAARPRVFSRLEAYYWVFA